jgi:hypothetical protein
MLVATASLSGAILLIIGTATAMAWGLTQSGFSGALAQAMGALPGGAPMFMAVSVVIFVILGSVLEGIPAVVLFGPLLFPIARALGIHEVHYAMVVLSMGLGLFAPPLGVGYYAACAIGRVHPDEGIRPMLGYALALLVGTIVVAALPWLSIGFLRGGRPPSGGRAQPPLQRPHQPAQQRQLGVQLLGGVPVVAVHRDPAVRGVEQVLAPRMVQRPVWPRRAKWKSQVRKASLPSVTATRTSKRGASRAWNMWAKMRPMAAWPRTSLKGP